MNIREEETTMNIQDLFNERNEQNKRITELVLKLEKQKEIINKIKEYIKENIADIEFMEKEYGIDILNTEIEVEYNDIKKLIELLEEIE